MLHYCVKKELSYFTLDILCWLFQNNSTTIKNILYFHWLPPMYFILPNLWKTAFEKCSDLICFRVNKPYLFKFLKFLCYISNRLNKSCKVRY